MATDVAQDCFLCLWEKQPENDPVKIKRFLFKIGRDIFISQYRHSKVVAAFAFNGDHQQQHVTSPEDEYNYQELQKKYNQALTAMDVKLREVFLMSRNEGLKNREIAERLGLSVKAVEKRMTKALGELKRVLVD